MSNLSLFSLFTAGLACLVPFASAYTQPVGAEPSGNPFSQPGLNSIVPAGEGFTITWKPTTDGPITLLLLKGPATNLKVESVIVESTANDGTYVWTPSTDLEPTTGATGYGIQLIVDSGANKGQYQYTTQFGISNPAYKKSSVSSSSSVVHTASAYAPSSAVHSAPAYAAPSSSSAISAPAYGHSSSASSTSEAPLKTASAYPSVSASQTAIYPTASVGNNTVPTAHASATSWSTQNSTATTFGTATATAANSTASETSKVFTGAASTMTTSFFGLVLAAGVAVLAY